MNGLSWYRPLFVRVLGPVPVDPQPRNGVTYKAFAWPASPHGDRKAGVLIVVQGQPVRLVRGEYEILWPV